MKASEFIKVLEEDDINYQLIWSETKSDSEFIQKDKDIDRQITDNIDVQVKWLIIELSIMESISDVKKTIGNRRREVLEYWKGMLVNKPKKYLEKSEITNMINNDKDVLDLMREEEKYSNILNLIKGFQKTLNNKHFAIGHYIDFKKSTNGFV